MKKKTIYNIILLVVLIGLMYILLAQPFGDLGNARDLTLQGLVSMFILFIAMPVDVTLLCLNNPELYDLFEPRP